MTAQEVADDIKQRLNDVGASILAHWEARGFPAMDAAEQELVDGFLHLKNSVHSADAKLLDAIQKFADEGPETYNEKRAGLFCGLSKVRSRCHPHLRSS